MQNDLMRSDMREASENISPYPKATEASFLTAAIMDVLTISMRCG